MHFTTEMGRLRADEAVTRAARYRAAMAAQRRAEGASAEQLAAPRVGVRRRLLFGRRAGAAVG
jgi:hypothetical protein